MISLGCSQNDHQPEARLRKMDDSLSNTLAPANDEGAPEPELEKDHLELQRARLQLETAKAELERAEVQRFRATLERDERRLEAQAEEAHAQPPHVAAGPGWKDTAKAADRGLATFLGYGLAGLFLLGAVRFSTFDHLPDRDRWATAGSLMVCALVVLGAMAWSRWRQG